MEQNKINAVIIAGLIVVGAGAWAGPMLMVQTANEFLGDLDNIEELSVALADEQGINFDQFGLGDLKDSVFLGAVSSFAPPPAFFGGPIVDLKAFKQQLIPPDLVGETVLTDEPGVFGAAVTLVEYKACDAANDVDDFNGAGNTGPAELENCQPAIIDKLFVMTPATLDGKVRVQLALCTNAQMANHQNDGSADNNPANDTCNFATATIIMDVIFQPFADHTEEIILDVGAVNPGSGNTLMVRAADNTAGAQQVNVWVGIKRVGSDGAVEFINPAQFGGAVPAACVEFTIQKSDGTSAGAGHTISIQAPSPPGVPPFNALLKTDANGNAEFKPVPNGFLIVDLQLTNGKIFFLDRPVSDTQHALATTPNDANEDANCNETVFRLPAGAI